MQDTEIKLAQCARCDAYVWRCHVNGSLVAVDPLPLVDEKHVLSHIMIGKSIFEVAFLTQGKRPDRLKWLGGVGTRWAPDGRTLVASHGCGANAGDARPVEVPPQGPQKAPAQPGRPSDGFPHRPALESGSQGRTAVRPIDWDKVGSSPSPQSPAKRANRRPSRPLTCQACLKLIKKGEEYVAIEHGRAFTWAMHDYDCAEHEAQPEPECPIDLNPDLADELYQIGGPAMMTRPIDNLELPDDSP